MSGRRACSGAVTVRGFCGVGDRPYFLCCGDCSGLANTVFALLLHLRAGRRILGGRQPPRMRGSGVVYARGCGGWAMFRFGVRHGFVGAPIDRAST
jgi:hypothetical protein